MKFKRENKGFSLVEVIVVIAIFAVVSIAIGGFLMAASRSYAVNANELNLQEEAQLVANQVQEMILDTSYGIAYQYVTTDGTGAELITYMESDATAPGDLTKKDLYIYSKDQYYHLYWDKDTSKLYLEEYEKNAAGTAYILVDGMPTGGVVLGEFISEFTVDLSKVASDRMVGFTINFKKNGSDRNYLVTRTVSLRNNVLTNKTADQVYEAAGEEFQPAADKLMVTPDSPITIWPGDMNQYRVSLTCSRGGVPSQNVTWEIASKDGTELSADTKITTSNVLYVGADEKAKELHLNVSADGYNFSTGDEITLRQPNYPTPIIVKIRQITGVTVTDESMNRNAVVAGGSYTVTVKMDGENLPTNLSEAGGLAYEFTKGKDYAKVTGYTESDKTATYTITINPDTPVGTEVAMAFRPEKEGFTHLVDETDVHKVTVPIDGVIVLNDNSSTTEWLRYGTRSVKASFATKSLQNEYCDDKGNLDAKYSLKYIYKFNNTEATIDVDKTVASENITNLSMPSSYESSAKLLGNKVLQSGKVEVRAELINRSTGAVLGKSNVVTYSIPQVTLAYKRAKDADAKNDLTVYITKKGNKEANKKANQVTIYVEVATGFEKDSSYTIDLNQFVEQDKTYGKITSRVSSNNTIEVTGSTTEKDYNGSNKIVIKHKELGSSFTVVLKKTNISTGTFTYYIPTDVNQWDKLTNDSNGYDYVYYVTDTMRMRIDYDSNKKKLGSLGGELEEYKNQVWNHQRTYYKIKDGSWTND